MGKATVSMDCPACGASGVFSVYIAWDRGDRITPPMNETYLTETVCTECMHELSDDECIKLEDDALEQDTWPESQYDTLEEKEMDQDD